MNTPITNIAELFKILTGEVPVSNREPCPKCGLTLAEFNRDGKFGCTHCYTHYREEFLAVTIPHQDGGCKHVGKRPQSPITAAKTFEENLKLLKLKMAKAREMENYEAANTYKKEIEELIKQHEGQ